MEKIEFDKGWKIKAIDATIDQLENRCRIFTYAYWFSYITGIVFLCFATGAYLIKYFYSGIYLLILGVGLMFVAINMADTKERLRILIYLKRQFEK